MDSRSKLSLVGRVAMALIATTLALLWVYLAVSHWSQLAARQPGWTIALVAVLLSAASVFSWVGIPNKRSWLVWVASSAVGICALVFTLNRLYHEPVTLGTVLRVVVSCLITVVLCHTAFTRGKQAIQARIPDNAEGQ